MSSLPDNPWPFDQPQNCVTFTTRQVLEGSEPILEVYHDADDHGWQFIGSSGGSFENAKVVALEEIVAMDRTVLEVADLLPGWKAFRTSHEMPWQRQLNDSGDS